MDFSIGKMAPDFKLPGSYGEEVTLKQFRGQPIILYFYPNDDTPGCTTEACEFKKDYHYFKRGNAIILGVSPNGLESHQKFIRKFELPFELLADEDHVVAEKYGLWVEKQMFGKKFMGVQRATYLLDKEGRFAKIWPKVSPEGHAAEVLAALKEL